jgi:fatty acid desaturase
MGSKVKFAGTAAPVRPKSRATDNDPIPRAVRIAYRLLGLIAAGVLAFELGSLTWPITLLCAGIVVEGMTISLLRSRR